MKPGIEFTDQTVQHSRLQTMVIRARSVVALVVARRTMRNGCS